MAGVIQFALSGPLELQHGVEADSQPRGEATSKENDPGGRAGGVEGAGMNIVISRLDFVASQQRLCKTCASPSS